MGRLRWLWVTLVPAAWLVTITMTASYQKIFHADPRIGFLSAAAQLSTQLAAGTIAPDRIAFTQRLIFNNKLDAAVTAVLAVMVLVLLFEALIEWFRILSGRKKAVLQETPYVATRWAEGD
jgi:carbon starvation protein